MCPTNYATGHVQTLPFRPVRLATLITSLLVLLACSNSSDEDEWLRLDITNQSGKTYTIRVELADTEQERTLGLSARQELAEDQGMLFLTPERRGFWMKDTIIPLAVAFIGPCGHIVHIAEMEPLSLEIHNTQSLYAFGLETNSGWFTKRGISAGSKVKIPRELKRPGCD